MWRSFRERITSDLEFEVSKSTIWKLTTSCVKCVSSTANWAQICTGCYFMYMFFDNYQQCSVSLRFCINRINHLTAMAYNIAPPQNVRFSFVLCTVQCGSKRNMNWAELNWKSTVEVTYFKKEDLHHKVTFFNRNTQQVDSKKPLAKSQSLSHLPVNINFSKPIVL